jgi:FeS assembly protein IscX
MHWSNIEELAVKLEESYAEEEIPEYNLEYLKEMVLSLSDFEDQEIEVRDNNLKQIMENWIDLRDEK